MSSDILSKLSPEEYDELVRELVDTRRDDLIRLAKAMDKKEKRPARCKSILQYYMKETGGGDPLTEDEMRQLKEAWGDVWKTGYVRPEWAALYKKKTGKFSPYYVGHDIHYYFTEWQKIDFDYIPALCDKNYLDVVFPEMKHPGTFVRKIHWVYLDEQFRPLTLSQAVQRVYDHRAEGAVVKISRGSYGGKGVNFVTADTTREEISGMLTSGRDVNVQKLIHQHPRMAAMNPSSVNSIRIMTMLVEGKPVVLSSVVRIGNAGSRVDNFSSGGIACGVKEDGVLTDVGYTKDGTQAETHPNGFRFKGYQVPGYQKAVDTVLRMHYRVPVFGIISWDIAIDENEDPVLIEYNVGQGGILTHQYNNGPLYGKYHNTIIKSVFKNFGARCTGATLDFSYTAEKGEAVVTAGSTAAERVVIPAQLDGARVSAIADSAFKDSAALQELEIRGDLDSIGYLAFYKCMALKKVVFTGTVRDFGRSCFNTCPELEELILPDGAKSVGIRAFAACKKLRRVVIPDSVASIADNAFESSKNVVICANPGSYAARFAADRGLPFRVL